MLRLERSALVEPLTKQGMSSGRMPMLNEIEIGETAERVRQYLDGCGASTPREINKTLKLDVVLFYMAIRRLAREDKIVISGHGKA